jgi:hypothetical protein
LQEKIDDLELRLQAMDHANIGLGRQLAELRDLRQSEIDQINKSVSQRSQPLQKLARIEPGPLWRGTSTGGEAKDLCRHCRGLDPGIGVDADGERSIENYSQLFLP